MRRINSQAAIHESRRIRSSSRGPGFSPSNINNSKSDSAQLLTAGKVCREGFHHWCWESWTSLPSNSLDLHHTQRQQDEILDGLPVFISLKKNSSNG